MDVYLFYFSFFGEWNLYQLGGVVKIHLFEKFTVL